MSRILNLSNQVLKPKVWTLKQFTKKEFFSSNPVIFENLKLNEIPKFDEEILQDYNFFSRFLKLLLKILYIARVCRKKN